MERVGKGLISPSRFTLGVTGVILLFIFLQGFPGIEGQSGKLTMTHCEICGNEYDNLLQQSFPKQQRVKRDDSGSDEDGDNCIQLPPRPPKSISSNAPMNLMDLLNNGSQYMMDDVEVNDAILILGNTGSGKTAISQIIAGNLSKLHAVRTRSGSLVIIDDDNRIGAPSTISKTLVPELVMAVDGVAFYDCPGFDDTRGPEKDIAANFFINQIMRRVNRVKLLFLVIHNSVKMGQDRLDLDLLVSHATKFLKRGGNYRDSIGLVVTKVDSYNDAGKFVKSKAVMKEIVEFLTMYLEDLRFQLNSESSTLSHVNNKIEFVETLLEQNEEGRYGRIAFSRSPLDCGSLSNSKVVLDTRERLIQLYSDELEYASVNLSDFGYTLKERTKLEILNFVDSLNEDVGEGVGAIMTVFKSWLDGWNSSNELIENIKAIRGSISALDSAGATWHNMKNSSDPQDLIQVLKLNLLSVGYTLPPHFLEFFKQQNNYFNFFDEMNSAMVNRRVGVWWRPVEDLKRTLIGNGEKLKLELRNQVMSMNQNLTGEISNVIIGFIDWYNSTYLKTNDLDVKLAEIKRATAGLEDILSRLKFFGDHSNPEDVARVIRPELESLGFEISIDFQNVISKFQAYFQYDDEVNAPGINRAVKQWLTQISKEAAALKDLGEKTGLELEIHQRNVQIAGLQHALEDARGQVSFLQRELLAKNSVNEEHSKEIGRLKEEAVTNVEKNNQLMREVTGLKDQLEAEKRKSDLINEHLESKANESRRLEVEHRNIVQLKLDRIRELEGADKNKFKFLESQNTANNDIIERQAEINRRCENNVDALRNGTELKISIIRKLAGTMRHSKLEDAIGAMDEEAVEILVALGADVNAANIKFATPLHQAANVTNKAFAMRAIKFLIKNGANSWAKDANNRTFLHILVESKLTPGEFHEISVLLIQRNLALLFNAPDNLKEVINLRTLLWSYKGSTPFQLYHSQWKTLRSRMPHSLS